MSEKRIMKKNKKIIYILALIPVIIMLTLLGWFFTLIFEGEKPVTALEPLPDYISKNQNFKIHIRDLKRGLKSLTISVKQEGREETIFENKFPFKGFLNSEGVHRYSYAFSIDPSALNLTQGRVDLNVSVRDYSRRGGGDGNLTLTHHKMMVDTLPPAIRTISRMHNVNKGGVCLSVFQASSDTEKSGIFVDDLFFPGFPVDSKSQKGIHECYFAIPSNSGSSPSIYLWAKDRAGNESRATFYHHIRRKRFRREKVKITDKFLKRVLPYFSFYALDKEKSDIKKYVKINNDLRKESNGIFLKLKEKTGHKKLWEGPWLRLNKAATMSRFGDRRSYYYEGKKVDEQVHLGVDLASHANSPVQASNHGRVIFAERLGIYGLTVVLDHGQGLASVYGHLSQIQVTPDQEVKKGDVLGFTGQTGLAGGDHLHFGVMLGGIFVNPIEWWDPHWIKDNINKKLAPIRE